MSWDRIKNNPSFRNISTIGFANILGNAISALFWIYLAQLLETTDYGELSYLISIAGIVSSISLFGGIWAMIVYTAKGIPLQSTLYIVAIIPSSLAAIVLFLVFESVGLSLFAIGYVIYNLTLAEILGRKLYKSYSKYFIFQKILFVMLALFFYYLVGPQGILIGYGISFLFSINKIYKSFKEIKLDFTLYKSKIGFVTNNYVYDLTSAVKGNIDKLIIGPLLGFGLLGNYYLGLQVVSILGFIPGVIFAYILPQDASGKSTKKLKVLTILLSVVLSIVGIFLVPVLISMFFPEYKESIELVPILSLSIIPTTIVSMLNSKFLGQERSVHALTGYLISLGTLISGIFILVGLFDVTGVAIAFLLSVVIQAIYLISINFFYDKS